MVEALDAEVRSASLVENVNSALRPLLETCRGQVDQEMLELFAFCIIIGALCAASAQGKPRSNS